MERSTFTGKPQITLCLQYIAQRTSKIHLIKTYSAIQPNRLTPINPINLSQSLYPFEKIKKGKKEKNEEGRGENKKEKRIWRITGWNAYEWQSRGENEIIHRRLGTSARWRKPQFPWTRFFRNLRRWRWNMGRKFRAIYIFYTHGSSRRP